MPDYDAIVIGAGHNGLTAAAVMARGGMRVLCVEKNHFIGGMASTNELVRGYQFELAGSIQFPIPTEIYDDLDFASCPIYEPEVQSAAVGPAGQPPLLLYSDPERLVDHLNDALGLEAVLGMAEVAGWAEAPARAIGRFDVRRPPKSLDEMWACASNEKERQAIRTAMFGSVMDVIDQFLPDRDQHAQVRSMLAFLSVNSTYRGPAHRGAPCAWPSPWPPPRRHHGQGPGRHRHPVRPPPRPVRAAHGGELRRHAKVVRDRGGRRSGSRVWTWVTARWPPPPSWSPTSTRPPPSPSSWPATPCPTRSPAGSTPSTTGPPTSRCTSPSTASPSTPGPTRCSTTGTFART